jgi:hypothetical protein
MLLSSGSAWRRLTWIGKTKIHKICFKELPGKYHTRRGGYFRSAILKMLTDNVEFSNISIKWFTEHIHIRRSYTELKKYTSKGGSYWAGHFKLDKNIFALLNRIFVTKNLCIVISSIHIHLCKTVLNLQSQASYLLLVQYCSNECCSNVVSNFASYLVGPEFHSWFAGSIMPNTYVVFLSSSMKMVGKDFKIFCNCSL